MISTSADPVAAALPRSS